MPWHYTLDELARILGEAAPDADTAFSAVSTDSRTVRPGEVFFALDGERFDGNLFVDDAIGNGAAAVVAKRAAASGPSIVVADPLAALHAFAAHHRRRFDLPVLAITGSCGKTTAKDLCAAVLGTRFQVTKTQGNLNNAIGCPRSLLEIQPETGFAVIEMGANHMGEIADLCALARPTESAITIIAPAHLEGFGSIDNVATAKGEIAEALPPSGRFYVNLDDPRCRAIGERIAAETVRFGTGGDVAIEEFTRMSPLETRVRIAPVGTLHLPLLCRAHVTNVLLAVAVGLHHGVTEFEGPMREALERTTRFKYRRIGPVDVIDDTYNANPASVQAALAAAAEWPGVTRRIAVLGDMFELGADAPEWHAAMGTAAAEAGIDILFGMGEHACATISAARAAQLPHAEHFDSHDTIAEAVHALARPGDLLLVKGSRGMRMERVLERLAARWAGEPAAS